MVTRREEEGPSFPPSLSSLPREIFEGKLRVINSELLFRERKRFRNDFSRGGSLRRRRAHRILEQPSLVLLHVFGRGFAYLGTLYRGNKRSRRRRIFDLLLFVSRETRISLLSFGTPYSSSRRNRERAHPRAFIPLKNYIFSRGTGERGYLFPCGYFHLERISLLSLSLPYLETLYLGNKRSREGEHWVPYSREVDLRSAHSLSLCLYVRN